MEIKSLPSPNFNDRIGVQSPNYIMLHYTGMKNTEDALSRLCNQDSGVSAHFTIDEDGTIYKHIDIEKRAWHAGKGFWRDITDMNSHSIGVEIVNPGHEHGYRAFPQNQIESVILLLKDLIKETLIPLQNTIAHSDYAPERKEDPGELFPWALLANEQVAMWPEPNEIDLEVVKNWNLDSYVNATREYGYNPDCGYEYVLRAFERHFMPELILSTSQDEKMAQARLACLLRLYGDKKLL